MRSWDELGVKDEPLLELAMELERIALRRRIFCSVANCSQMWTSIRASS